MNGITSTHIEKLQSVDESYLRKILGAPITTAKEAIYMETGKILLFLIIKMRRLLYWWNLVNQKNESMLYKVYKAQESEPVKGDWNKILQDDKKYFEFEFTDDELLQKYPKKDKFKNAITKKAILLTERYIISKKEGHTKLDDLKFEKLKCASYLEDPRISRREAKLLFQLRTRMYNVK